MSYILEALKKAQAERQLGSTPGLHDVAALSAAARPVPGQARLWMALGAALFLAAGGVAILRVLAPQEPAAAPALPVPARVHAAAPPVAPPVPVAARAPAAQRSAPVEVVQAAPAADPAPAATAPEAQPDDTLQTLAGLPPTVSAGIPGVTLGGYIYSPVPSERLLLVDKDLRREGEEVAPGLILEKLLPSGAVMNYRGTRFRMPY